MPGIAGVISCAPAAECRLQVNRMLETMAHESFYVSGRCSSPELGVYVGWVAHPGSYAAEHSRHDSVDGIDGVFAGECVQDESPLALYRRRGKDAVAELNGVFSGVLLDHARRRAILFNDRYGIERIYVHETRDAIYFASEAKALLRVLPATRAFDDRAVADFLTFGCALDGRTLFKGIDALAPASVWTAEGRSIHKARYFDPQHWERQGELPPQEYEAAFQERFTQALLRTLRGTDPLGISLTGGLDTRMIMAALPASARSPVCYTFAGIDGETLDARVARQVAATCGLEHRLVRIGADFLSDFGAYVDRTVFVTDGASGALGAHEIYLNARARALAATRLTGNFGSEVLRSMSTFKPSNLAPDLVAPDFRGQLEAARRATIGTASPVTFAVFREIPWSLFGTMAAAKSQVIFRTPYLDNDVVSLAYRAPAALRLSAGPSLRFVRQNQPALATLPTDRAVVTNGSGITYRLKRLAAEATFKLDYWHKEALAPSRLPLESAMRALGRAGLLGRHKYLPYRLWFRTEVAAYVSDVVTDPTTARMPYWNRAFLSRLAHDHIGGTANRMREINAVITLAGVERVLIGIEHHASVTRDAARDDVALVNCVRR